MSRRQITIFIILVLLVIGPALELWREQFSYDRYSTRLRQGYPQITEGTPRQDVITLLGKPDVVTNTSNQQVMQWDAGTHQGFLWKLFHLSSITGHYAVSVSFDANGRSTLSWGGLN